MKCRVVKNSKGEVLAAYPIEDGAVKIELQLKRGERVVEMNISKKEMVDQKKYLRACSSVK